MLSAVVAGALATSLAVPTAAHAGYGYPLETPSGVHVLSATPSSFTIGLTRAPHALVYRVYASTSRAAVYAANVTSSTKQAASTSPSITVSGLAYTSAPYWYRVVTEHGTSKRWGTIYAAGVQPAAPTGVSLSNTGHGISLTWNPQSAAGFAVTQATNPEMTENRITRLVYGPHYQVTPYALTKGVRYYFQVRGRNYGSYGGYSAQVSGTPTVSQQSVRVVSYNVTMASTAGQHPPGSEVYAPWSSRIGGVVKLIKQGTPDVAAIQEAGDWGGRVHGYGGYRMVDAIAYYLPGYVVARTEVPPSEHYYGRYSSYVVYKSSAWTPVGAGGHWALDSGHYAAWQVLRSRSTGAAALFTSAHLVAGHSASLDAARARETASLLSQAKTVADRYGVPVVYAGDFNSTTNAGYGTDAPDIAMRNQHITDSRMAAVYRYNEFYNSANQYRRLPPLYGHSIDHVFAGPGIAVRSWGVIANLSRDAFVGTIPSDHDPVWATITIPSP